MFKFLGVLRLSFFEQSPSFSIRQTLRLSIVPLCFLLLCGCERGAQWVNVESSSGVDVNGLAEDSRRVIVSVPAQIDAFLKKHPQGPEAFGRQVVNHLDGFVGNGRFFYAPKLPASNDRVWTQGPVAAAAGAHLIILCELLDIQSIKVPGTSQHDRVIEVQAQLRVIDKDGKELWRKSHTARMPKNNSPKFRTGSNCTESRAMWEANRQCIQALKSWLDVQSDKEMFDGTQQPLNTAARITLTVDSIPSGADVLIDGKLKGTTPCALKLDMNEIELRIEHSAYKTWQRRFTPEEDMALKPSLQVK